MTQLEVDIKTDTSTRTNFVTFPFDPDIAEGGLTSVILREGHMPGNSVVCLSGGTREFEIGRVKVLPADELTNPNPDIFKRWFAEQWPLLYSNAYTVATLSRDVLREMYAAATPEDQHQIGSLDFLHEYLNRHSPGAHVERTQMARFNGLLGSIPQNSVVNWQDYFFEPCINQFADQLRSLGVFQTFHLHEAIHPGLHRSAWGRSFLTALSRVDVVYAHTEQYVTTLHEELAAMERVNPGIRIPTIKRFDLGIDSGWIDSSLDTVNRGNYDQVVQGYAHLEPTQHALIEEVFRTQGVVPHRFICLDRIDATKGVLTELDGIDLFLEEKLSRGNTLDDLRRNFRFFFAHELLQVEHYKADNLKDQYVRIVKERHQQLAEKYPGIVFVCRSIRGEARAIIPALVRGCHGITGGADDGLNLAIGEIAYANRDQNTTIVAGDGAGFSIEARRRGFGEDAFFPRAGHPGEFKDALEAIEDRHAKAPWELGARKGRLLVEYLGRRQDGVVVNE